VVHAPFDANSPPTSRVTGWTGEIDARSSIDRKGGMTMMLHAMRAAPRCANYDFVVIVPPGEIARPEPDA
jgi:hypothetical protein